MKYYYIEEDKIITVSSSFSFNTLHILRPDLISKGLKPKKSLLCIPLGYKIKKDILVPTKAKKKELLESKNKKECYNYLVSSLLTLVEVVSGEKPIEDIQHISKRAKEILNNKEL